MKRAALILAAVTALSGAAAVAQEAGEKAFEPIFEGGGIQVYTKVDFDSGANPFINEASGVVALETRPEYVVGGRSLHVKRAKPGGHFGGRTNQIAVKGTTGLNIAFCIRAKGMRNVALNFYDALKRDNTTPSSPARVQDDVWRTVVYAVEDFHHNADPPQQKVPANTRHTNLFFHGTEQPGASSEYWIDNFIIYRGVDTQPPEAPGGLKAKAGKDGSVELTWKEPKDNAFPAAYSIYRKPDKGRWAKVGESIQPGFVDTLPAGGRYSYRVTAADYDRNVSEPSREAKVKADAGGKVEPAADERVNDRLGYTENVRAIHAAGRGKVRHDVYLFAGDSITAADAYTHTLGQWLARGIPVRRGVGQMRTDFGKAMIGKYLEESKPEFAIVMYGTNDSKSAQAVEQAMSNLAAVIDACAQFGTVPILATIPPRGYEKDKQDDQIRFNQALIKLCREKKVPASYCYEEMMQQELKQMLSDGTHLTPGPGNDAAGSALWKTMQQVFFALTDASGTFK